MPWIEDPQRVAHTGDSMQCSNACPDARLAPAAIVCENIENIRLQDIQINWPDGAPPADLAVKCELGEPQIDPHNDDHEPAQFHALWLRNTNGHIEHEHLSGLTQSLSQPSNTLKQGNPDYDTL